jgi:hypothetical protein
VKLAYQVIGGGGAYVTLYDEQGPAQPFDAAAQTPGAWPVFEPQFRGTNQQDAVFTTPGGDAAQFKQPLGNVTATVQASFDVGYASRAAAMESVNTYQKLLGQPIHLQVTEGVTIHYYPNAIFTDYKGRPQGLNCNHTFSFTSDRIGTAVPPP